MADRGSRRPPYPRAQLITAWALHNKVWVNGELTLAGIEPTTLKDWIAVRYALLVRANSNALTTAAQVLDEFEKQSKTYMIDETTWGTGPDAIAGQQGLEALIAKQPAR